MKALLSGCKSAPLETTFAKGEQGIFIAHNIPAQPIIIITTRIITLVVKTSFMTKTSFLHLFL